MYAQEFYSVGSAYIFNALKTKNAFLLVTGKRYLFLQMGKSPFALELF
jgi:hypothetical protein